MKKFIIQSVLLLLVIGIGIVFFAPGRPGPSSLEVPFFPKPVKISNLQINDQVLKVEIADTSAKRSKGLAGRDSMLDDEGMLFIFERADKYPFWMKGLKFPLDFVWIKDLAVVDILENVQAPTPGQSDSTLSIYSAKTEVDKVLELNAGTVQRLNIKIGDNIKINP